MTITMSQKNTTNLEVKIWKTILHSDYYNSAHKDKMRVWTNITAREPDKCEEVILLASKFLDAKRAYRGND